MEDYEIDIKEYAERPYSVPRGSYYLLRLLIPAYIAIGGLMAYCNSKERLSSEDNPRIEQKGEQTERLFNIYSK